MNYELIKLKTVGGDNTGSLTFFESSRDIAFDIRRVYCISGTAKGTLRGGHAHIELEQLLFCPYGSIEIIMDDGIDRESVLLDKAEKGLLLPPKIWHEMKWMTEGAVLCVAASMNYDESDYIRDYSEFMKLNRKNGQENGIR